MTRQCFVLTPFGSLFDEYYRGVLAPAIRAADLDPKRADEIYGPRFIIGDIVQGIRDSVVLVADVTGRNPNVNYELGLAHAFSRPVVIISQSVDDIPFDYRHLRVIIYNTREVDWAAKLSAEITRGLEAAIAPHSPAWPYDEKWALSSQAKLCFYPKHEDAFSRVDEEIRLRAQSRTSDDALLVRVLGDRGRFICPWLQGFIHRYEEEDWFSGISFSYYLLDSDYAKSIAGFASQVDSIEAGTRLIERIGNRLKASGSSVTAECIRYRGLNPFQAFLIGTDALMLSFFRPRFIKGEVGDWIGPSKNGYYFFQRIEAAHHLAIDTVIDWIRFLDTISDRAPNPGHQADG